MPGSVGEYRVVETLGWVDGYRGAMAVFAVPMLFWVRAIASRIKHRKNDPDVIEGHRVDW